MPTDDQMYVASWAKKEAGINFVRENMWAWSADTDMGPFFIEVRGDKYYAFHSSIMLHNAKRPYIRLGDAIQRCEDAYHQLKWGDRC